MIKKKAYRLAILLPFTKRSSRSHRTICIKIDSSFIVHTAYIPEDEISQYLLVMNHDGMKWCSESSLSPINCGLRLTVAIINDAVLFLAATVEFRLDGLVISIILCAYFMLLKRHNDYFTSI